MAEDLAPDPLSAEALPALLTGVHAALHHQREAIDALNVFPVPDGDTGSNMTLTVAASRSALSAAHARDASVAAVRGAVRGARGNSGVILSQVLRALAEGVEAGLRGTEGLAHILARARDLAYEAVATPVEGTILTAIAVAADAAAEAARAHDALPGALDQIAARVHTAVEDSPRQLAVLAEHGVVDAGARGFEVVIAALASFARGEPVAEAPLDAVSEAAPATVHESCTQATDYRFEVQYLLDAADDAAPDLRRALEILGDSVVVVGAGDLLNVHVHTDEVGGALEEGARRGRPSQIQVVDLVDQVRRRVERDDGAVSALGCVAVVAGPGITRVVEEVGAVVVEGAGGELPSVADLLDGVGRLRAKRAVILPGHANVVAAAHRASAVSVAEGGREIDVLDAATSPPAILAALAVCDPEADGAAVLADMRAAADGVRVGEVVPAVRDATTPFGAVTAGQHLSVAGGEVVGAYDDPLDALRELTRACDPSGSEMVTVIIGADVGAAEREAALGVLDDAATQAELEVIDGGQRPSRYWIGLA